MNHDITSHPKQYKNQIRIESHSEHYKNKMRIIRDHTQNTIRAR